MTGDPWKDVFDIMKKYIKGEAVDNEKRHAGYGHNLIHGP